MLVRYNLRYNLPQTLGCPQSPAVLILFSAKKKNLNASKPSNQSKGLGESTCLKKNQTTPRPSEHPPVMGGKLSKRLGGIKRLQIQNHFMAFEQVPRCR